MRLFVWLGGALFAAALALTAWTYGVAFGRPVRYQGWRAMLLDTLLFSCFALHHSLFARAGMKARIARVVPPSLMRSVYVWVASGLLIVVDLVWIPIGGTVYSIAWPAAAVCAGVQLTGVWLTVRSARAIDPLELAGIRDNRVGVDLQVGGPYRLVRHPLYLGWVLMVLGPAHMTGDRLVFALVSTCYLGIAIPFEERSLVRLFGMQYERYRDRVRWRMIPYVY